MILKNKVWILLSICLCLVPALASLAQDTTGASAEATSEATAELTAAVTPTPAPEATIEVTDEAGEPVIIIVIEGPVQAVNINIITIYNIDIEVDPADPVLTVVHIGDVLRIKGEMRGRHHEHNRITLVAIVIIFVNVDVVVVDGQVWRDAGNCDNPPPSWAPAHGWHDRCDHPVVTGGGGGGGTTVIIIGGGGDGGSGSGMGMGMGMGKNK